MWRKGTLRLALMAPLSTASRNPLLENHSSEGPRHFRFTDRDFFQFSVMNDCLLEEEGFQGKMTGLGPSDFYALYRTYGVCLAWLLLSSLPHSVYAMKHGTPAAALLSETCVSDISTGDKRSTLTAGDKHSMWGLKRTLSCAASTLCVGSRFSPCRVALNQSRPMM